MARLTCALKTSQQRDSAWIGGKIAVFDLIRESRHRTIAIEGLDFRQRPSTSRRRNGHAACACGRIGRGITECAPS